MFCTICRKLVELLLLRTRESYLFRNTVERHFGCPWWCLARGVNDGACCFRRVGRVGKLRKYEIVVRCCGCQGEDDQGVNEILNLLWRLGIEPRSTIDIQISGSRSLVVQTAIIVIQI